MAILQQIKVPLLSVNDTSLTVVDILFPQGAPVKQGDLLLEFETSKTTYEVVAETEGYVQYFCETGNDYEVNELVATIVSNAEEIIEMVAPAVKVNKNGKKAVPDTAASIGTWEGDTLFTHAAIELMEMNGLSKEIFKGWDLVSREDVMNLTGKSAKKNKAVERKGTNATIILADPDKVIIKQLSSNKKREIDYLSEVQATGLTSTINTIVDTEGLFLHVNHSLQYLKNSLLPLLVYETARLLEKYRELNAYFTGDSIAYYKEINIGFAIDIDKGLKVMKIPGAAGKGMGEIESTIMSLSNKYLDDQLQLDDLTDITFTVTDLSAEAVSFFIPLVNMKNSAILGVSSIDEKLNRCILSVTFDHRITEGKLVAQFLHELKGRIESYRSEYYPAINQEITCFKCIKTLKEDLSDVGFAKCITPDGKEAYICQSCLKGF